MFGDHIVFHKGKLVEFNDWISPRRRQTRTDCSYDEAVKRVMDDMLDGAQIYKSVGYAHKQAPKITGSVWDIEVPELVTISE